MSAGCPTRKISPSAPSTASATAWAAGSSPSLWIATTCGGFWSRSRRARWSTGSVIRRGRSGAAGQVVGESAIMTGEEIDEGMAVLLVREPTPEVAAQFAEDYERLLAKLENPTLRSIALRKLEGHTTDEIAEELGTSRRTSIASSS